MSLSSNKYNSLNRIYSCKYFRVFYKDSSCRSLEISISKKYFKRAVDRNKIKRIIKEIFRRDSMSEIFCGEVIFSVFSPFGELSYGQAREEINKVVDSFLSQN